MPTTEIHEPPAPLDRFRLFKSTDLDEARTFVARTFCDHRLAVTRAGAGLDACHNHVRGAQLSLNYIRYGADVAIEPGELGSFYLFQIPVSGGSTIRHGRRELTTTCQRASVLNPDRHTAMRWHEGCEKILIQVDKNALSRLVETLSGHSLSGPVRFDPEIDFARPELARWRAHVCALFAAADDGRAFAKSAVPFQRLLEDELLSAFVIHQPGNARHLLADERRVARPRHVKRALDYIRANLDAPIGLDEIAEAAGVTGRTLQLAFRESFGMSPLAVARRERLKQVQFALLNRDPETSIGDIAARWGFFHLGRFSALYRAEFGCLPSETKPLH
ncbi:AraC family transcriptional regulator [Amorphus sp. 3PC139-8]|uniref:AraC family transcriptional regulator n=1 Tax=Amorphus sp. 3PC139-8 TaxID=2735676 RepID=UPI00345DF375